MTTEPTNADRAQWARDALAVFTNRTYSGDHPDTKHRDDLATAVTDLIADLMHLAVKQDLDPYEALDDAVAHFKVELREETRS